MISCLPSLCWTKDSSSSIFWTTRHRDRHIIQLSVCTEPRMRLRGCSHRLQRPSSTLDVCPINFMHPKRRVTKDEQKMKCGFSIDISMVRSPNRVITLLKRTSKHRISYFVTIVTKKTSDDHPCISRVCTGPSEPNSCSPNEILCLPNEDFGKGYKRWNRVF